MSDSKMGVKRKEFSNETRKKMSKSHIGNHHSSDTKSKISIGNLGKKYTEEVRKKMSILKMGKNTKLLDVLIVKKWVE